MSHRCPVCNAAPDHLQCADDRRRRSWCCICIAVHTCGCLLHPDREPALQISYCRRCVSATRRRRCQPHLVGLQRRVCCGQRRWVLRRFVFCWVGRASFCWSGRLPGLAAEGTKWLSPRCRGRVIRVPRSMCTADRALPHCVRPPSPRVPATGAFGIRRRLRVAQPCRIGALRCWRPWPV